MGRMSSIGGTKRRDRRQPDPECRGDCGARSRGEAATDLPSAPATPRGPRPRPRLTKVCHRDAPALTDPTSSFPTDVPGSANSARVGWSPFSAVVDRVQVRERLSQQARTGRNTRSCSRGSRRSRRASKRGSGSASTGPSWRVSAGWAVCLHHPEAVFEQKAAASWN